jgi:tetratricopeptide (TPR) repeat protein
MAYYPVIDVLKSNFDIREGERDFEIRQKVKKGIESIQADEASTLPYLLELLLVKNGGIDQTPMSPGIRKARTLDALTRIVLKGSEVRPFIMAIEDLHWVDKSSEESFMQLLESISGARVLLIFTYRPEFVHTWGVRSYHSQLNLNRLSNRESLLMVAHLLGTNEVAPDLENLILDKTEGVPFFIEEFIKSLKNLRLIESKRDKCHLTGQTQDLVIPSTIQDVIMARVDTLPEGAKEVLLRGSVIGREFSHELIKEITNLDEPELLSFLAALRDSELIYERGIYPACTYIALTCEVIYESILTKKRKKLHLEIGKAIEKIQSERLEEVYEILAYHYSNSENSEKAYHYLKLSGNKAVTNYANNDAFRYYKSAIELLTMMPETEENKRKQIDVRLSLWHPMHNLGYPEGSLKILQDGERISEEIKDEKSLAIFYSKLGHYYTSMGEPLLGIQYSEKCFQEAAKIEDVDLMAPIAIELSVAYTAAGEFSKIPEMAHRVISLLEKTHKESEFFGRPFNVYPELYGHCGYSLARLGEFNEGEALCEKGLRFAHRMNHLGTLGVVELTYSHLFFVKGDGENAITHSKNSIKYFEEGKVHIILPWAWTNLGTGHYYLGEFETALKHVQKGLKMQKDVGISMLMSWLYHDMGMIHLGLGELKSAQSCAEEALDLAQKNHEKHIEGMSWTLMGRVLGKKEPAEIDKSKEYILKGIQILEELKLKPHVSVGHFYLGELYADTGNQHQALNHLKKADEMFREMGMDYWLSKTQKAMDKL